MLWCERNEALGVEGMTRTRFGIASGAAVAVLALGAGAAWAHGRAGHDDGGRRAATPALARVGGANPVTAYLGIGAGRLRADLKAGQTLAQIANATPGRSAAGLVQALTAAAKSKLDAAVAAGKLTAAQEQFVLGKLTPAITSIVNGASLTNLGMHIPGVQGALAYLGLTTVQVLGDLAHGMSLAQIANATPGKSAAGLIQTLEAAAKAQLDTAVTAGVLTPAREQALLTRIDVLVAAVVNGHR
jgi:hypothetical protein